MFLTDKFCYISISRTGTRSVIKILNEVISKYNLKHYDISTFHFTNELFKNSKLPFTFTFVREPYTRSLSLFTHVIKEGWFSGTFVEYLELVKNYFTNPCITIHNDKVKDQEGFLNIIQEAIPQYHYIYDKNDETKVDFIGRYEKIDEDWKQLSLILNELYDIKLEKLPILNERIDKLGVDMKNKNFILEYNKTEFTEEIKKLIQEIYEKDFKLLNYDKNYEILQKKSINVRLESELNDAYFKLYNSCEENDEIRYKLSLDLYKKVEERLPKEERDNILNQHIIKMKDMNNDQKVEYLLKNIVLYSIHIFKKYCCE